MRALLTLTRPSHYQKELPWTLRGMPVFRTHFALIVSRFVGIAFALSVSSGVLCSGSARADTSDPIKLFEDALQANADFENQRLQEIVSSRPELLLERNKNGLTLIDFAFFYLNEDLVSQTNFDFLKHLSSNDFYGQKIDRSEHFSFAVQALRGADDQIGRIDLPDDMIVHSSREPFIALLSDTIADRLSQDPLNSAGSLELVLDICDPKAFHLGQEKFFGKQLTQAIASTLVPQHKSFVEVYAQSGTLNANCVEALLS
ncbi:hypothetical protein [Ruegeria arenilitoris]|uniref:hypothetical protein n=1 Tax=Ruegeria arenilitoris TaxID=1173585 RepID=UPI00147B0D7C|nr:hypothetical protein [Ruegeria arenilitoris]